MFSPMDIFHISIYVHLPIVFCVNHIHIGSFEPNRICFVFCQMDGCFDYFNKYDKTCIGRKNVRTSVTLEHTSLLIDRQIYKLIVYFNCGEVDSRL
jgi:hypothetical protein